MEYTIQHVSTEKVNKISFKINKKWKNLFRFDYITFFLFHLETSFCLELICFLSFPVDTPLSQVKLGEIGAWISRRDKNPRAIAGAFSRAWWRWQHKYVQPKRAGIAPMLQLIAGSMVFFYAINYNKMRKFLTKQFFGIPFLTSLFHLTENHRNYKHH